MHTCIDQGSSKLAPTIKAESHLQQLNIKTSPREEEDPASPITYRDDVPPHQDPKPLLLPRHHSLDSHMAQSQNLSWNPSPLVGRVKRSSCHKGPTGWESLLMGSQEVDVGVLSPGHLLPVPCMSWKAHIKIKRGVGWGHGMPGCLPKAELHHWPRGFLLYKPVMLFLIPMSAQ